MRRYRPVQSLLLTLGAAAALLAAACSTGGGLGSATPLPPVAGSIPQSQHGSRHTSPPPSQFIDDTWSGVHLFLPFDNFKNKYVFTPGQAQTDGPLYDAVWGSNTPQMVAAWHTNHPTLRAGYYITIGTDALLTQFGQLGHPISWWQANHPDWILYECDQKTVAYLGGLPTVPLDISNPAVINYLVNLIGTYAENNGYDMLSMDLANPVNPTGGQKGGTHGCGVWTEQNFQRIWVQKFSGQQVDPTYTSAILNYLSAVDQFAHSQSRPMAVWGNNSVGTVTPGDATEQKFVAALDVVSDETGFANYGKFATDKQFNNIVSWSSTIQGQGKGYLVTALFKTSQLTNPEVEYAMATYLMEKAQAAAMTAYPYGMYGTDQYQAAYGAPIGTPCGPMYGGPSYLHKGQYVYYRAYSGGLSVVNTKVGTPYTVSLPQLSYTDAVTGQTVNSPLTVGPDTGFVLLNSAGCP